jgi:hypothetical protein
MDTRMVDDTDGIGMLHSLLYMLAPKGKPTISRVTYKKAKRPKDLEATP